MAADIGRCDHEPPRLKRTAVFTMIDANQHTEDWTFAIPGKAPFHAVMDVKRVP